MASIGGKVFDPSYGKKYASDAAFEAGTVGGFVLGTKISVKQAKGDADDKPTPSVEVFLYRSPSASGNLVPTKVAEQKD